MYLFIDNNENTRTVCEVLHQNDFGVLRVDFATSIAALNKLMLIGCFKVGIPTNTLIIGFLNRIGVTEKV